MKMGILDFTTTAVNNPEHRGIDKMRVLSNSVQKQFLVKSIPLPEAINR
jgi:hypothetical protein